MQVLHESGRFYIRAAGGDCELKYKVEGKSISIYHTFIPGKERGKGLAEKLATAAFEWATSKGLKVKPDCDYIKHFLEKHGEFGASVAAAKS